MALRVFYDTNVLLDVALNRDPWVEHSAQVLGLANSGRVQGFTSSMSLATVYYITRKLTDKDNAEFFAYALAGFLRFASFPERLPTEMQIEKSRSKDFEDDLQYAHAHHSSCEVLLTRNVEDFPSYWPIQVMTPKAYLDQRKGAISHTS